MRSFNRTSNIALLTLLLLTFAVPAHAYVDPNTGSFVIQLMVAGAVGALFAVKSFWARIVISVGHLFGRKKAENLSPDA